MADPVAKEVGEAFSQGCAGARKVAREVVPASVFFSVGMAFRSAGKWSALSSRRGKRLRERERERGAKRQRGQLREAESGARCIQIPPPPPLCPTSILLRVAWRNGPRMTEESLRRVAACAC